MALRDGLVSYDLDAEEMFVMEEMIVVTSKHTRGAVVAPKSVSLQAILFRTV